MSESRREMTLRVLHLEDNPDDAFLVKRFLDQPRDPLIEVEQVDRLGVALKRLEQGGIDLVISDLKLPDSNGLKSLLSLRAQAPHMPIILLTGTFEETQTALEAIQRGAQDYLLKSEMTATLLMRSIRYAIERKHSEEALQEKETTLRAAHEQLKHLSAVKDQFLAHVSHELRTPLAGIKEGISLLRDGTLGSVNARQAEFLALVDSSVDRLAGLIGNMLDLSKIEAGRLYLRRKSVSPRPLIEEVLAGYKGLAGRRTLRVQGGNVPDVFADPDRIIQVVTNLLSNAMKFTREEGIIEMTLRKQDGAVTVSVKDDGVGIAKEDLPKLFQKFSQVGEGKMRKGGTGLGLALCKELVGLHGGTIDVVSEWGKGATFSFTLPRYTPQRALEESFKEVVRGSEASKKETVAMIVMDVNPLLEGSSSPEDRAHRLSQIVELVQQNVHGDDVALSIEPARVVIVAVTDREGARSIVGRMQQCFKVPVNVGIALYPADGPDAHSLLTKAACIR